MKSGHQVVPHRIALWGPVGSGKTWLINALGRSLVNFQPDDPDFSYELREYTDDSFDPFVVPIAPPRYTPTSELIDFMWLFRRRAKQNTFAHQISSQTHILHIHDVGGIDAVRLTNKVKENYTNVQLLLLVLDPINLGKYSEKTFNKQMSNNIEQPIVNNSQAQLVSANDNKQLTIMTRELYLSSIKQLLDYVGESNTKRPFVAICITKRDLWKENISSELAIKHWFGNQMFDMLGQYSREFTLKTFIMTSCGYLEGATEKPNYSKNNGELLNISQWNPRGVVNPLFWFLDNREREILFPRKSFFRSILGRNPLRHFISYPTVD